MAGTPSQTPQRSATPIKCTHWRFVASAPPPPPRPSKRLNKVPVHFEEVRTGREPPSRPRER